MNHCHNTVHEDFALLMRIQLLQRRRGNATGNRYATPNPTPDGVFFTTPEVLPEGVPTSSASTTAPTSGQSPTNQSHGGSGPSKA